MFDGEVRRRGIGCCEEVVEVVVDGGELGWPYGVVGGHVYVPGWFVRVRKD